MATLTVNLGERSYPVCIAQGGFAQLPPLLEERFAGRRAILVTEDIVGPLWSAQVANELAGLGWDLEVMVLKSGEQNKTIASWSHCVTGLLERGVDRSTPVLALGGGVLGDIVGFAAASALRGVPFVQLPTTLLAMADSSVGGKTAVNHARGKNLVGAFYQPRLVYACLDTLSTLPREEVAAGLAEMIKIALIADPALFSQLEELGPVIAAGDFTVLSAPLQRCVELKAQVVARDERESGARAVLNLGHTVAHGIEAGAGPGGIAHGFAVGIGLVLETRWAIREGYCESDGLDLRIANLLSACGLPTSCPEMSKGRVVKAMKFDKKAKGAKVRVPVLRRIGAVTQVDIPKSHLETLL
jgi:3-dehydroquinate synthase